MGDAARLRAESFTWERSADEAEEHLTTCASSTARHAETAAVRAFAIAVEPRLESTVAVKAGLPPQPLALHP
jgi:hypothetical protein